MTNFMYIFFIYKYKNNVSKEIDTLPLYAMLCYAMLCRIMTGFQPVCNTSLQFVTIAKKMENSTKNNPTHQPICPKINLMLK